MIVGGRARCEMPLKLLQTVVQLPAADFVSYGCRSTGEWDVRWGYDLDLTHGHMYGIPHSAHFGQLIAVTKRGVVGLMDLGVCVCALSSKTELQSYLWRGGSHQKDDGPKQLATRCAMSRETTSRGEPALTAREDSDSSSSAMFFFWKVPGANYQRPVEEWVHLLGLICSNTLLLRTFN